MSPAAMYSFALQHHGLVLFWRRIGCCGLMGGVSAFTQRHVQRPVQRIHDFGNAFDGAGIGRFGGNGGISDRLAW